jgi:hypothetical protein
MRFIIGFLPTLIEECSAFVLAKNPGMPISSSLLVTHEPFPQIVSSPLMFQTAVDISRELPFVHEILVGFVDKVIPKDRLYQFSMVYETTDGTIGFSYMFNKRSFLFHYIVYMSTF